MIAVSPRYTSRRCAVCRHNALANRVRQALFSCRACGHTTNAGINVARHILAAGQADRLNACVLLCGTRNLRP